MSKKFNPIICVDFDGVIHSYTSGWKAAGIVSDPPVDGAIEWLIGKMPNFVDGGYLWTDGQPEIQIYSSRSKYPAGIKAMKEWLIEHCFPRQFIDDNVLKFPTEKPAAFLTIDDRAICFDGKFPTTEAMISFKPWYKK